MQVHGTLIDERKNYHSSLIPYILYTANKYSTTETQMYIYYYNHSYGFILKIDNIILTSF